MQDPSIKAGCSTKKPREEPGGYPSYFWCRSKRGIISLSNWRIDAKTDFLFVVPMVSLTRWSLSVFVSSVLWTQESNVWVFLMLHCLLNENESLHWIGSAAKWIINFFITTVVVELSVSVCYHPFVCLYFWQHWTTLWVLGSSGSCLYNADV